MLQTHFSPFPELATDRLMLRRIADDDTDDLFLLRCDKRVMEYIDRPLAQTPADAAKLIRLIDDNLTAGNGISWAITLKGETPLVGTIGLWRFMKEDYRAEIGYLLHPDLQGRGLMQEALAAVLGYGFSTIRLHSVEANVNPGNAASIRLLEKSGFVREAYFRENYYFNGVFKDTAIYSLLTPDR